MSEVVAMRARKHTGLEIAPTFHLPLDAATETFAILGRRGSGKTHTAVVMAEEFLAAGVQLVVIDPLDVWWGLRVSKDGKSAGIPIYVCGGSHADVPLVADAGKVLADAVVDKGLSVILSLRHLSKSDQRRFVGEFCDRLYDRKGDQAHRSTLHLFIDEADAFVPQRIIPGSERCFGAVDTLVRRGRSSGLATTLISQRPQVINKDVLSQTEVLVSHQVTGPQDRKALESWIEANDEANHRAEFLGSLASLPRGTAWFWSPGLLNVFARQQVRDRRTFDSSATPKPGARTVTPTAFAAVDIEALTQEIAATVERAKADDPKELRRQLAEKDREIGRLRTATPAGPAAAAPAKDVPALTDGDRELLTSLVRRVEDWSAKLNEAAETAHERLGHRITDALQSFISEINAATDTRQAQFAATLQTAGFQKVVEKIAALQAPQPSLHRQKPEVRTEASAQRAQPQRDAATTRPSFGAQASGEKLAGGERKILTALAQYPDGRTKVQIALLTGYAHNGGGFNNYLSGLRSRGFIEGGGEDVRITNTGLAALGPYDPLPTGRDLLDHWLRQLGKAERLVLEALAEVYPRAMSKEDAGARTGYEPSGGGFNNALSRLRTLELIEGRGELRASADLFG